MLRQTFIMRSCNKKVALVIVVNLWLLYLYKQRENYSVLENNRKISQSQTQKGQMCQQSMSAAQTTGFDSLPTTMKEFLYYRHCRHFPLLLDSPDKCGREEEVFLLLVIKSSPGNYGLREVLRKTWAKERQINGLWVRRIFISGTAGVDGFEKIRMNKLLELEQQEHNDIIQWDFTDTFFNLTLKQVLFMEWSGKNCPNVQFLLIGNDDAFANTNNMVEYLQSLNEGNGNKHLYTGFVFDSHDPLRQIKSKLPVQVRKSNAYPPYCGGGGYLLSGYTAAVIRKMSQSIILYPNDAAYVGMCLRKAGLGPKSHSGFLTFGLGIPSKEIDPFEPCLYKDLLLVDRFLPAEIYLMWNKILDPDLKCPIPIKKQN